MAIRSTLDDLLLRWEEMHRRGKNTSLEELCKATPELLESLRSKVRALCALDPILRDESASQIADPQELGIDHLCKSTHSFRPGSEPVEGYILDEPLGRGGYGEVWKARGPGGFPVAMKFVSLAGHIADSEIRALETIKNLHHPHLLPIFGAWQDKNMLIIATELAEQTLYDLFGKVASQDSPGIPKEELLRYMQQAAEALDYLNASHHRIGEKKNLAIQHRDVKPQNLLLVGGAVKLGDFGLVRILEKSATGHTGSLSVSYAPPEFFKGKTTQNSDQYSLAITYCLLRGGRLPFIGNTGQILEGHLRRNPDLSMLPAEEQSQVARALAKGHNFRWPSCKAFVDSLSGAQETFARGAINTVALGTYIQSSASPTNSTPETPDPRSQAHSIIDTKSVPVTSKLVSSPIRWIVSILVLGAVYFLAFSIHKQERPQNAAVDVKENAKETRSKTKAAPKAIAENKVGPVATKIAPEQPASGIPLAPPTNDFEIAPVQPRAEVSPVKPNLLPEKDPAREAISPQMKLLPKPYQLQVSAKTNIGDPDRALNEKASTGLYLPKGTIISISAPGTWRVGPFGKHLRGADILGVAIGKPNERALQYRAGDERGQFVVKESGFLFLGITDTSVRDNSGFLLVTVDVKVVGRVGDAAAR